MILSEGENEGGADREQAYRWLTDNIEAGQIIVIAEKTNHFLS